MLSSRNASQIYLRRRLLFTVAVVALLGIVGFGVLSTISVAPRAKAVQVLDEYGPGGFTIKIADVATVNDTVGFVTDALLDEGGTPVEGVPITFTLARPNETTVQWIQKTDQEGRIRGSILASALEGRTGSFTISAVGEGIPNPGELFSFYVGEQTVYSIDLPDGLSSRSVPFLQTRPNANYDASCNANYNTTCWVTNKTTTGYTINVGTAPSGFSGKIIYRIENGVPIPQ